MIKLKATLAKISSKVSAISSFSLLEKCRYSEFFSSYSVQMRENTEQENSEYGNVSRSVFPDDDVTLFILGKYKYKMIQAEVKNNI